ncbi:MAG: hypothetical protein IID38_04425 [Planctomycetes bacterium]|nr:hypothetical protein [Planctomycetota bacterium]
MGKLKEALPYTDLTEFEKSPDVSKMADLFTVDTILKYVEGRLAAA